MQLDAPQSRYQQLENYYEGRQPLAFLSPDAAKALDGRFSRMSSNIPRLAVTSIAERLRIIGFTGADVWDDWVKNDLDQLCMSAHRDALLYGSSFVVVWAGADGTPQVSIESPKQMQVARDPGSREITAAVKRWRTKTQTFAVLYLPDRIEKWVAQTAGPATSGFELIEILDNPLGVVPVVELKNVDRTLVLGPWAGFAMFEPGLSEIDDLMPLVDGLNKMLTDLMVTSEYVGRPRRWATGIDLVERPILDADGNPVLDGNGEPKTEAVNPIPEGARAMVAEKPETKFGQLDSADLSHYEKGVGVLLGQIMAVSALPAHYIGITTANPATADAMRAAEASLTARAEARQLVFGRGWETVAKLMVAVRDSVPVAVVQVRIQWADASTRTLAQDTDAVVKMLQAGLLSKSGALRRLGYTQDEIDRELYDAERDALANANPEFSMAIAKHAELTAERMNQHGSPFPGTKMVDGQLKAA
ncbi:phage portal protein [Mycobacterium sp. CBMA226]|nr:phage portal protein [Mycolicibacterium sp. CBMA 226]MUL78642.1 phage portal protein [Mycolicibacterium sp. CBMA 226]